MPSESRTKVPGPRFRLRLDALGACLRIETDEPELVRQLRCELGPLIHDDFPGPPDLSLESRPAAPDERTVHGDAAFGLIYRAWLDRVDRYAIAHGAALARDGRALVLAGPTGSGKTTLTLALLRRGFSLLSDDFAPLDLERGTVAPFPKSLGVRPGAAAELARAAGGAIDERSRVALDPRALQDVDRLDQPVPLGAVLLMNGGASAPSPIDPFPFYVSFREDGATLARALREVPGLLPIACGTDAGRLHFRLDPRSGAIAALEQVISDHAAAVIEYGAAALEAPGSAELTRLHPIAPTTALVLVLRELQNRRRGGALMARFADDTARLSSALAARLARIPVRWLHAGDPLDAAAAIDRFFRDL